MGKFAAVILAGGKGTRLAQMDLELPKALVALDGKPLLEWIISWTKIAASELIVAGGHNPEYFAPKIESNPLVTSDPDAGTGRALLNAARRTDADHIIVCNADTINDLDLYALLHQHSFSGKGATIALTRRRDAQNAAAFAVAEDGQILRSKEDLQPSGHGNPYTQWRGASTGVMIIPRIALLDARIQTALSLEQEIVPHLIDSVGLFAFDNGNRLCLDIGEPERLKLMENNQKKLSGIFRKLLIQKNQQKP